MSEKRAKSGNIHRSDLHLRQLSAEALAGLEADGAEVGGPYCPPAEANGAIGFTHFDSPAADNEQLVVLLTMENIEKLPLQSLVRVKSLPNKELGLKARTYQGVVTAGPFAEPDGLRTDSSIVVATTVEGRGRVLLPRYHGRALIQLLGEEVAGQLIPPRLRPRPNSPVFPLTAEETAAVLKAGGNARLGLLVGQNSIVVGVDTTLKSVLPRHTGILGTTGSGKSTTVARLVHQFQKAGMAVVLLDVEGEYTEIDHSTSDPAMIAALARRRLRPEGVKDVSVLHLIGRDTSREMLPKEVLRPFSIRFCDLSPYSVMDILGLPEAQQERFLKTYDTLKLIMRHLGVFPRKGDRSEEQKALELDELETGYPRMTLRMMIDVANSFHDWSSLTANEAKTKDAADWAQSYPVVSPELRSHDAVIRRFVKNANPPRNITSWRGLLGKLLRIGRLNVFDNTGATALDPAALTTAGQVSVIDLSDTDSPSVNNLVIASVLRQVQVHQELNFQAATTTGRPPTPTVIIIEEAHEFLSASRIRQQPHLFEQIARIAKRGRKRWLGLVFVTQLPQHLPDDVLGLINNYVLHKISDPSVVDRLRRSIPGLDRGQWSLVPSLAPGQAIVSTTSAARPLLVSIDPAPCRLRLVT